MLMSLLVKVRFFWWSVRALSALLVQCELQQWCVISSNIYEMSLF